MGDRIGSSPITRTKTVKPELRKEFGFLVVYVWLNLTQADAETAFAVMVIIISGGNLQIRR